MNVACTATVGYAGSNGECTCAAGYNGAVTSGATTSTLNGCTACPSGKYSPAGNNNKCLACTGTTGYTGTDGSACSCAEGYLGTVIYTNTFLSGCCTGADIL